MCYAKPGPRCHAHAKADLDKLNGQIGNRETRLKKLKVDTVFFAREYERLSEAPDCPPETVKFYRKMTTDTAKDADNLGRRVRKLKDKQKISQEEANSTKGGIEALREEINAVRRNGRGAEFLEDDLSKAETKYADRMEKYDSKYKTVDGRKPSPYGNDEGIKKLQEKYKDNEKKLRNLHGRELSENVSLTKQIDSVKESQRRLKGQLAHAYATDRHYRSGILYSPERIAELRQQAADKDREAQESYERSDSDGFMSQWASGLGADKKRMEAELLENGGKAEFSALFNSNGDMVPAKQVTVADRFRPGSRRTVWGVLSDPNDPESPVKEWINESSSNNMKTREAYLAKKGFTMGTVKVPAYVATRGEQTNVSNVFVRKDKGYSPDAEVVTKNRYPGLIEFYKNHDKTQSQIEWEADQDKK